MPPLVNQSTTKIYLIRNLVVCFVSKVLLTDLSRYRTFYFTYVKILHKMVVSSWQFLGPMVGKEQSFGQTVQDLKFPHGEIVCIVIYLEI